MKRTAIAALAAAFIAAPAIASADTTAHGPTQFATSVQNQLIRHGFHHVDASDLTTNQLAHIHSALSSESVKLSDQIRQVNRIVERG